MAQAKTFYTYAELAKRNTEALIRVYNRIFNTNAWENWFNPYEHRTDMLLELMEEMRLQKALALLPAFERSAEPYKAVKLEVTPNGIAVLWNVGPKASKRSITPEVMEIVRDLADEGKTMQQIADILSIGKKVVFEVLSGRYAEGDNRWKAAAAAKANAAPVKIVHRFEARGEVLMQAVAVQPQPMNDFWAGLGL